MQEFLCWAAAAVVITLGLIVHIRRGGKAPRGALRSAGVASGLVAAVKSVVAGDGGDDA